MDLQAFLGAGGLASGVVVGLYYYAQKLQNIWIVIDA
jgi:hypothetical protein